jgi:ribosome-associated heat shock protein Hsp15
MSGVRLDKWLWYARFARTRSLAARLCAAGRVTIGGVPILKPGHVLRVGDQLTVEQGMMRRRVTALALGERRGPAIEARRLYAEPLPAERLADAEQAPWIPLLDEAGDGDAAMP